MTENDNLFENVVEIKLLVCICGCMRCFALHFLFDTIQTGLGLLQNKNEK